jgi:hypothetical protein
VPARDTSVMSVRRQALLVSRWLNRFLFGAGVARANDQVSQLDTIVRAYLANLVVIFCLVGALLAAADLHPSLRAPFFSMIPFALAISNVATFGATYLASLSWSANPDLIKRVREAVRARGRPGELINRYVIPVALALWGLASLFLTIALFGTLKLGLGHPLGYGSLFASIGANAVFLQMLLVRRWTQLVGRIS